MFSLDIVNKRYSNFYLCRMKTNTQKINEEILRLSIPNILSNVSVPLLSSVDTFLMGYEASAAAYIGAVGLGAMFFNLLYWGFGFLRMGTTGMTAQAFGRKDKEGIIGTFGRGVLVAMVTSTIFLLLQVPLESVSIYLMAADADTAPLVSEYFKIRIWAAPAALGLMVFMGWFFGMQNAFYPLLLTLIINISNIILSWILVRNNGMGIVGVAWGTVVAQYVGLLVAIILFLFKYKEYAKELEFSLITKWSAFKSFFLINRDIFIRTICLIAAFGFFYNRSSIMGVTLLAVNQIFMQYINWMSYAVDGFAFASESLVGKYEGAKNEAMKSEAIKWTFIWGGGFAVLFSLLFLLGGKGLLSIFTDDPEVLNVGTNYLIWIIIYPILGFASFMWDGVFIGLTASKAMRDTMFLSLIAFVISYFALQQFENHGLWGAMLVYVTARGILQWIWYRKLITNYE